MQRILTAVWMTALIALPSISVAADETAEMAAKIAALEAKIAELEARQRDHWLDERRAEEIKVLVRDVLRDADTRVSLLDNRMTAGHDGKFFIASSDGSFRLNLEGQLQVRYIVNVRNNSGDDDFESGFTIRRGKIKFNGHIGDPRIDFKITLASDRDGGDVYLEEALISHSYDVGIKVSVGRFKPKVLREEFTSSSAQLAVERSAMNELLTWGFSEAIEVAYEGQETFRLYATLNDGPGAGEYSATKDFHKDNSDLAFTFRADVKIMGEWKQMKDFTGTAGEPMALFVGGAVAYNIAETGDIGGMPNDNLLTWTIDASIEAEGFNAFIAFIGNHELNRDTPDVDEYALVLQGGYRFYNDQIEPFVRWEHLFADANSRTTWTRDVDIVTVGVNYYIIGQKAKATADVVWAMDPIPDGSSGLDMLDDAAGQSDQVLMRLQLQLLF